MPIKTMEDARCFVERIRDIYPFVGDPEFTFISRRSGQPVAHVVTVDPDGAWYVWRKVVGRAGGAYDQRRTRIDDPVGFVYRYRVDISRTLAEPAIEGVPESKWNLALLDKD